jgi:diguanylate cyclase (GGDEF)-like protein
MDSSRPAVLDDSVFQIKHANETVGSLAEQSIPAPVVQQDTTLRHISKLLQCDSTQSGVLIHTGDGEYTPIYRERMFIQLARPFAKDLFYDRPAIDFLDRHHESNLLELTTRTTISQAIEASLDRPTEFRYDPVLVRLGEDEPPRMIDVRVLLERQRDLLGRALSQVNRQREEAYIASTHDRLTGLPNRQNVMLRLGEMCRSHSRDKTHDFAVLFLDFDRFKLINDSLGHDAGDELLIQISTRLQDTLARFTGEEQPSKKWMAARLGGDEFLLLLDDIEGIEQAETLADQVLSDMQPYFSLRGYDVISLPSIGIATCQGSDGTSTSAMVRDADAAMYRAKARGRARYVLFDQSMQNEAFERLYLESQLRSAAELNEFHAFYQPIVNCESGEIAGFEALVRWQHRELGMVSPGRFIPIAEECGVITAIGRFMLEEAIAQLAQWNSQRGDAPPLYMSINVSKRQLLQPGCIDHMAKVIEDAGVPPQLIYLEVTETLVMEQGDKIIQTLKEIKALGVQLSMDDFGTGMSSLTHLHQYPVDVLKIDQAFVKHLEEKSMYTAVVLAIVTLAKNLGMSIVVEGIERIEQLVQIQALDCDYAQGYLFSKPAPAHEAVKLLTRKKQPSGRKHVA